MKPNRKTKIVATVGPASRDVKKLKELITAGVNVFRLNFTHGSHEEHLENLKNIQEASKATGITVGVLQDLSGPKVRSTDLKSNDPLVNSGDIVTIKYSKEKSESTNDTIYSSAVNPANFSEVGHTILLADGALALKVLSVDKVEGVKCELIKGGKLRSRMGIAFPDSMVNIPAVTEKDLIDLQWGLENKIDFIAVSFIQTAADIKKIQDKLVHLSNIEKPLVIAKIEMRTAVENLDEIIEISDGVMVARGDLGVELPIEMVPTIQRRIITKANALGKPVIVATQMLHSMINSNRPTRAEVTDVSTAVMSGADAVMLSEETAIGEFPVESVEYLCKISTVAEQEFNYDIFKLRFKEEGVEPSIPDAIGYAACAAAYNLNAAAIIACTETGFSSKLIGKHRPSQTLYGVTYRQSSLRRMSLYWGVSGLIMEKQQGSEIEQALKTIQSNENLENSDIAIVTGGLTVRVPGATSVMEIKKFGE